MLLKAEPVVTAVEAIQQMGTAGHLITEMSLTADHLVVIGPK